MTKTHGLSLTFEYRAWIRMWQRVKARPDHPDYQTYVLKGVHVDPRWKTFEPFLSDVGPSPSRQHTLDRFPNGQGNYEPGNVRWATQQEQQNNRSNNRIVEFDGQRRTLSEWARSIGIREDMLRHRLVKGWSIEKALRTPSRKWSHG